MNILLNRFVATDVGHCRLKFDGCVVLGTGNLVKVKSILEVHILPMSFIVMMIYFRLI